MSHNRKFFWSEWNEQVLKGFIFYRTAYILHYNLICLSCKVAVCNLMNSWVDWYRHREDWVTHLQWKVTMTRLTKPATHFNNHKQILILLESLFDIVWNITAFTKKKFVLFLNYLHKYQITIFFIKEQNFLIFVFDRYFYIFCHQIFIFNIISEFKLDRVIAPIVNGEHTPLVYISKCSLYIEKVQFTNFQVKCDQLEINQNFNLNMWMPGQVENIMPTLSYSGA